MRDPDPHPRCSPIVPGPGPPSRGQSRCPYLGAFPGSPSPVLRSVVRPGPSTPGAAPVLGPRSRFPGQPRCPDPDPQPRCRDPDLHPRCPEPHPTPGGSPGARPAVLSPGTGPPPLVPGPQPPGQPRCPEPDPQPRCPNPHSQLCPGTPLPEHPRCRNLGAAPVAPQGCSGTRTPAHVAAPVSPVPRAVSWGAGGGFLPCRGRVAAPAAAPPPRRAWGGPGERLQHRGAGARPVLATAGGGRGGAGRGPGCSRRGGTSPGHGPTVPPPPLRRFSRSTPTGFQLLHRFMSPPTVLVRSGVGGLGLPCPPLRGAGTADPPLPSLSGAGGCSVPGFWDILWLQEPALQQNKWRCAGWCLLSPGPRQRVHPCLTCSKTLSLPSNPFLAPKSFLCPKTLT